MAFSQLSVQSYQEIISTILVIRIDAEQWNKTATPFCIIKETCQTASALVEEVFSKRTSLLANCVLEEKKDKD
ncbi:hypothetical protein D917_07883 [Trichinella nativa]|uniref:Uncharacterized protein n=1 Tax=Trichinella nativa TaxID=6335 RepID=A0A1Y3EQU5_9BILA|nr:hypothetical protein D917_07883 [Trichinella nativa]